MSISENLSGCLFENGTFVHILPLEEDDQSFDQEFHDLLQQWDLLVLEAELKNAGITYRSLRYLSKEDVKDAIKNIGLRAEFRERLFLWKKEKFNIDEETVSLDSKVVSWIKSVAGTSFESSPRESSVNEFQSILKGVLAYELINLIMANQIFGIKPFKEDLCITEDFIFVFHISKIVYDLFNKNLIRSDI